MQCKTSWCPSALYSQRCTALLSLELNAVHIFLYTQSLQGTILAFVTEFFADFLATDSVDDLVALLKKARLDERLLEFFPPQQRTLEQFNAHFKV